ncbi:LmeA family phospholipid-binding protein [Corynebacterium crudilactis]|uniref:DUF2993 domain-containing protein n=1 Tax=Corynebacterium crudilactis TaxID=1652495 RepID=A0A172QQZ4_9CORY|nr:DUF2993 domain-containing protein [Corynebacterium crudilactis]ANE03115.1 hypothetical protein ccrud_02080 [Corynebacterium crudilactis]
MAKTKKSAFPKVLLTIVVILLLLVLVAEFGLRFMIGKQLKDEFQAQVSDQGITSTEEPSISFGASPLLLGLAKGSINEVTIDTPDTLSISNQDGSPAISGTPEANVQLKGLAIRDTNNPVAQNLTLTTFAPDDFILATVQQQMAQAASGNGESAGLAGQIIQELVKITDVTSNAENQSVEVEFTDGAARASLRPIVLNGQLAFEVLDSQLFGFGLPDQVSQMLTDGVKASIEEVAGGLQIDNIEVADGGINVTLTGENINVRTLESVQ